MNNTNLDLYDVFIIGSGPSGLTAGIYAARACLKTAIIEKNYLGGKLNQTLSLENYPGFLETSGPKLAVDMAQQTKDNGVVFFSGNVTDIKKKNENGNKIWEIIADKQVFYSKTILICSGTKEKKIGIENEDKYYGNGVSYCAICDGNLYKGQDVVVVGGGNSAVEESIYLSKIVKNVFLVHRRNEFTADKKYLEHIKNIKNIKILTPNIAVKIIDENNNVIGLKIKNVETLKEEFIKAQCIFFYIGLVPENYFLKSLNLNISGDGFIIANSNMETNIPGIFASGDILKKNLRQVVTAINDGAVAAITIKNYINDNYTK